MPRAHFEKKQPLVIFFFFGSPLVERFWLIPSLVARALAKCDVNQGSLSLMILLGMPNHRTMLSKYS